MARTVVHAGTGRSQGDQSVTGSLHANTGEYPARIAAVHPAGQSVPTGTLSAVRGATPHPRQPRSADPRVRSALLMPLAALAVHQGRYDLAFGAHTPARMLRDGHAYLGSVVPFTALGAALALGLWAGRLARAWHGGGRGSRPTAPRPHSLLRIWALISIVLLSLYCVQELTEGALAAGHAGGLTGVAGSGGWLAVPLAIAAGGVLTLMLRAGDALVELLTGLRSRPRLSAPPRAWRVNARCRTDWRLAGGSGVSAGRAPPLALGSR
jgi:hypothetical protein